MIDLMVRIEHYHYALSLSFCHVISMHFLSKKKYEVFTAKLNIS